MSILSEFLTMLGVQDDFCIQLRGCEKISSRSETVPERGWQGAEGPKSGGVASYMTRF
uniref:Uncharacterized protein n=1 Tax=Candidatus Kentrum sp. FM TaxID=2126340 RepID=A0A450TLU8_9GAMM|nr:MAG: hypothetical protein BECKFM1743A_GA0114220_1000913 [Candidatus Kentron sp. FM]VFJ68686.1 MAG: hypothetical protein BECKFM1743C_GA0114222_104943 [Candidatus Kentron sp. FM]